MVGTRHSVVTPEQVADVMGAGLDKAKLLMKRTTQKGVRTAVYPVFRKYRTDTTRLKSKYLEEKWYFDWMPAKLQSIGGAKGAYVMTNGSFTSVFPAESKKNDQARDCLQKFIDEVGTPRDVKTDNDTALVNKNSAFLTLLRKEGISHRFSEPGRSTRCTRSI